MAALIDRVEKVYGRLTVISRAARQSPTQSSWICRCECGNFSVVTGNRLEIGKTQSCGCLKLGNKSAAKHGHAGNRISPTYYSWVSMKNRCGNPKHKGWRWYGGKGISFDPRWIKFECFLADVGERPSRKHTLNRLSHDGNYQPGNVCWSVNHQETV